MTFLFVLDRFINVLKSIPFRWPSTRNNVVHYNIVFLFYKQFSLFLNNQEIFQFFLLCLFLWQGRLFYLYEYDYKNYFEHHSKLYCLSSRVFMY